MIIASLSEAVIRRQTTPQSFDRGEHYYGDGAVVSLVERGNVLQAEVFGSQYEPYRVQVTFDEGGITDAVCSCPYDWGGWCKHIVAVLLACLHEPELIEARPALDELLSGLDRQQLRDLVLRLAGRDPSGVDEIERLIALSQTTSDRSKADAPRDLPPQQRTQLNPQPIRRQVSGILNSLDHMRRSAAYWHVSSVVNQVRHLLRQVEVLIKAEEGRHGLSLLEAITDAYVADWTGLDDSDGYAGAFFGDLGAAWTEAGRAVDDLTAEERARLAQALTRWQAEVGGYGLDGVFEAALAAIQGGGDL
jgi:uncharacterized Zn finger protein